MDYVTITINFLGSLGLFLFGMKVLSAALQKSAGGKMKKMLGTMSKTRFRGVLFGAGVCAVIQSSTATTVMAVGFVNAGIISLSQTVGITMGANVGSTTTSWLVSSAEWASFMKPAVLGAVATFVGAMVLLFAKNDKLKSISEVIVGFGVLFVGLSNMPVAVKPLAESEIMGNAFATLGGNPLLCLLVGILVTGIIQSSSASIGILQSMAFTGIIPWSAAVFIILGQNVGTCFTTMLTSIGTNRNTRASSYIHFVYNVLGAVIFTVVGVLVFAFYPELGEQSVSSTHVSMVHTGYNVLLLLILFPFGNAILKLSIKMAGGEDAPVEIEKKCIVFDELDESILETPDYALTNSVKAVEKLTHLLRDNISLINEIFINHKFEHIDEFRTKFETIAGANRRIREFLTKLYNAKLTAELHTDVTSLMHNLASFEKINNHTRAMMALAEEVRDTKLTYSPEAVEALQNIRTEVLACYDGAVETLLTGEQSAAETAIRYAESIHELRQSYKRSGCFGSFAEGDAGKNVRGGIVFLEAVRHMTRITSHSKSVVETVMLETDEAEV